MRFIGLTLCLLASSLGARAESVEERITALEARVKALEQELQKTAPPTAVENKAGSFSIEDGHLKAAKGHEKIDFVTSK